MSVLRRLLLILLGLALAALVVVLFLAPDTVIAFAGSIASLHHTIRVAFVVVTVLVILLMLYLAVRPSPYRVKDGLIVRSSGALADVTTDSARERLLRVVRGVPGVASADATLTAINGRADIELEVIVTGDNVNVPQKQKEIDKALRQVMLKQLGLSLARKPRVHIVLESERRHREPAPAASVVPSPQPPPVAPAPLPSEPVQSTPPAPPPVAPAQVASPETPPSTDAPVVGVAATRDETPSVALVTTDVAPPAEASRSEPETQAGLDSPVLEQVDPPAAETDLDRELDFANRLDDWGALLPSEEELAPVNHRASARSDWQSSDEPSTGLYDRGESGDQPDDQESDEEPPIPPPA